MSARSAHRADIPLLWNPKRLERPVELFDLLLVEPRRAPVAEPLRDPRALKQRGSRGEEREEVGARDFLPNVKRGFATVVGDVLEVRLEDRVWCR